MNPASPVRKSSTAPRRGRGSAVRFAPSILSADMANLAADIRKAVKARCSWIHLDMMDGHFVPNLTFGPPVVRAICRAVPKAFYDAHLMVNQPSLYVKDLVEAGVQLITIHQESCGNDTLPLLRQIRRAGIQTGVSIKPKTPITAIESCLSTVDLVLVMTVEPGFGGQKLIPSALNKVRQLVHAREKAKATFLIQVDGGINTETAHLAVAAGADVLVAGSAIFGKGNVADNVRALRESLAKLM